MNVQNEVRDLLQRLQPARLPNLATAAEAEDAVASLLLEEARVLESLGEGATEQTVDVSKQENSGFE